MPNLFQPLIPGLLSWLGSVVQNPTLLFFALFTVVGIVGIYCLNIMGKYEDAWKVFVLTTVSNVAIFLPKSMPSLEQLAVSFLVGLLVGVATYSWVRRVRQMEVINRRAQEDFQRLRGISVDLRERIENLEHRLIEKQYSPVEWC